LTNNTFLVKYLHLLLIYRRRSELNASRTLSSERIYDAIFFYFICLVNLVRVRCGLSKKRTSVCQNISCVLLTSQFSCYFSRGSAIDYMFNGIKLLRNDKRAKNQIYAQGFYSQSPWNLLKIKTIDHHKTTIQTKAFRLIKKLIVHTVKALFSEIRFFRKSLYLLEVNEAAVYE
jgi:hypothetical protein